VRTAHAASIDRRKLASRLRLQLLGPDLHRLDRTSLRLAHSLDHFIGKRAGERVSATMAQGSPCGGLQYAARRATDQEYAARRLKPARMRPCHQRHRLHAHASWLA
jgi:hypothetical protein